MSSIMGLVGICFGLYYVLTHPSGSFQGYFDFPSMLLLVILPPSIILLSHRISDFFTGVQILLQSMFNNTQKLQEHVINALTVCSAKVRAEGVGALVAERNKLRYELMIDGVSLIVNNFTPEEIKHNLSGKINSKQQHMAIAINLFENMSRLAPAVGMMGTVIGLIQMMSNMSDPSSIGGGMATALITTLYGLLLGNVLYAPFGDKITIEAKKIYELDLMVLEGVLALKGKKSSVHLKDIMKTYSRAQPSSDGAKNK